MQQVNIAYHAEHCLKNKHSRMFVGVQSHAQLLKANHPPSWIQTPDMLKLNPQERQEYTLRVKFVSRDIEKQKILEKDRPVEFLIDGCKVHLINSATDEYITCSSTGEIKFDKKSNFNDDLNKHLFKASTWTVQLLKNQTKVILSGNQILTFYDDICFKSVHSTYLTMRVGTYELSASKDLDQYGVWNAMRANVPFIPKWLFTRPCFKKFSNIQLPNEHEIPPLPPVEKKLLKSFPPQKQQVLLIEDFFDVMMGFDTTYIKKHKHHDYFVIEPHLEQPSCTLQNKQSVEKLLELPRHYYKIERYVKSFQMQEGILCQSLCGGLRKLMKEYLTMVVQFDGETRRKGMTFQRMLFLIQLPLKVMQALSKVIDQSENLRGGQLITALTKLLNDCSDQDILPIYNSLFAYVIQEYIQMLTKWLYEGIIEDKYGEFMIKTEEKSVNKQWAYWQQKFVIREDMVPSIFAKEANQILVTGKYVNILKACNKFDEYPDKKYMYMHMEKYVALKNFSEPIELVYLWTNQRMLELVFKDSRMEEVLRSIKGYFFMECGDLFVHLMDAAGEDFCMLRKKGVQQQQEGYKAKVFSEEKIKNLFELLVRTSSANSDPFKDDVSCRLQTVPIYQQMHRIKTQQPQKLFFDHLQKPFIKKDSRYLDYFTLDYKCTFPLTLIFNKKTMSKYQVMFRFMFWCKSLERQLNSTWLSLQATKKTRLDILAPAYLLVQRMLTFLKNFIYYVCDEVIEEHWLTFTKSLKQVKTFEGIIELQNAFLNKCLVESLLAHSDLLKILTAQVGRVCQGVANIRVIVEKLFSEFNFQPIAANPKTGSIISQRNIQVQQMRQRAEKQLSVRGEFREKVNESGQQFDDAMRMFLREVYQMQLFVLSNRIGKQHNHLLNLVNRLDEEKYYNRRLFNKNQATF